MNRRTHLLVCGWALTGVVVVYRLGGASCVLVERLLLWRVGWECKLLNW